MLSSSSFKALKGQNFSRSIKQLPRFLYPASDRTYFTFMDRLKQKINLPMRHIRAFM